MATMADTRNSSSIIEYLFVEMADPRVKDWLLMSSPSVLLTIVAAYLHFIFVLGPKIMKNREPFDLKYILIIYNFLQMLLSIYIMVETLDNSWLKNYSLRCQPVDYSWTPEALRVARGVHIYHLAKVSELLDTVFFVLRKKSSQITFLHIYHHTMMCLVTWGITKYIPGGHITLISVMNSFVHIIMYFYYMVSAFGNKYQKYLWWKKYITSLQLIQFVITLLHSIQVFFYDCGYPKMTLLITVPNSILFYFLFSEFYSKQYKQELKKKDYWSRSSTKESCCELNGVNNNNKEYKKLR